MKRLFSVILLILLIGCNTIENKMGHFFDKKSNENPKLIALPSKNPLEVKIAVFLPFSGKYQYLGQSILDSIQLALYELRADNITYRAIDVGSDPISTQKAMENVNLDDIDIILGPVFKDQAEHIYKQAKENNLLMITYSNDLDLMNTQGLYIFDIIPSQQIKKVALYASSKQYSNIYSVAPKNKYGDFVEKTLLENMGADHYNVKKVSLYTASDIPVVKRFTLSEAILGIKSSVKGDITNKIPRFGHPAILLPEQNNNLINVVNQLQFLHSSNDPQYKILGIGDWSRYSLTQNIITQKAWIADIPHKTLSEFDSRFQDNYKYTPPRIAAIAYDSIMLISAIINKANSGIILKFEELERTDGYQGITVAFRLKSNGANDMLFSVYEYEKGNMKEIAPANTGF